MGELTSVIKPKRSTFSMVAGAIVTANKKLYGGIGAAGGGVGVGVGAGAGVGGRGGTGEHRGVNRRVCAKSPTV